MPNENGHEIKCLYLVENKYLGKQAVHDTPRSAQVNKCLKNTPAAESLKINVNLCNVFVNTHRSRLWKTQAQKAMELKCYI